MAPVKKRIRRGRRRKCKKFSNNDNKWTLFHLNIRGFHSKQKSLDAILTKLRPNLVTLNETCLKNRQKITLSNYKSFNRNRCDGQIMGGISTSVIDEEKQYVVKTAEGSDSDEFMITRHANFHNPVNVIVIYGEQESKVKDLDIENRWRRIYDEIVKIEIRKEACIIVGDMNKHIGNDELGVRNNHPKITFGGELVRSLLAEGDFICLNNHPNATGGPFTRVDLANPAKLSCLDLVLISRNLLPFFKSITIDSGRKYSPVRPINKNEVRHSDHFPVIVTFENIPLLKPIKLGRNAHTIWNTNKQGGWDAFKESTQKSDEFDKIIDATKCNTEIVTNLEKLLSKKKFASFGKVKVRNKTVNKDLQKLYEVKASKMEQKDDIEDVEKAISVKLLELQKEEVEKEIEQVMTVKKSRGRSAAVFNTFQKICGDKKSNQEQVAMIDPVSKVPIFEPNEIKAVSLKYCVDLLTKRNVDEKYEDDFFIQDMIHLVCCEDVSDYNDEELNLEDFEERLKTLKTKCQNKYKFLLNSGDGYKECLFNLFTKIWASENKPQQWRNTIIVQIFKQKGDASDFNNQRNIHTKEDTPKFFEGIVVDKSKNKLTQACSKFQIGGIPGHRPQEHLFSVKSMIGLYKYLNIPLFLSYWDISKYFDKEILRDARQGYAANFTAFGIC